MIRLLRLPLRALAASACIALLLGSAALGATPASKAAAKSNDAAAAKLVHAALEAELAGNAGQRAQSLHDAIELAPEHAPARWHSAQLKFGDEWLPVEEIARRTRGNERLAAYRQKRDSLIDTADNHRELARWCDKQQLHAQGRVHWTKVLEFESGNPEAIRALGLQMHDGRLMTREQIEEEQVSEGKQLRALRTWQPRISEWRIALVGSNAEKHARAIQELEAFREPLAVDALVAAFSGDGKRFTALNQQLIEALERIPDRVATNALLQLAVVPQSEEFRIAAAKALGKRSPATYMPQLIAGLPPVEEVETKHSYTYVVGGLFFREHEILIRDVEKGTSQSLLLQDFDFPGFGADPTSMRTRMRLHVMNREVTNTERQLAEKRQAIEDTRQRIELALQNATGCREQWSAEQWLTKFDELTESYTPRSTGIPEGPGTFRLEIPIVRFSMSCFPAGTRILTANGRVGIETIRPGDQVISQDIETGEIAIQSVQQVTLRPAAPLLEIGIGGDHILATRGHPFWVDGKGWQMAKHLAVGQLLHTPNGSLAIEQLGEKPAQEAYNLVVSDFGTYFVGDSQVLVHDNVPPSESAVLVPGLAATTTP
jgi:hypothetical protein